MNTLIVNAKIVNEGKVTESDLLIRHERIEKIGSGLAPSGAVQVIDAGGNLLLPGIIDDQVHFREPGLTHKGDIHSESRAAVAGGITSYMEMPNTVPQTLTQEKLEEKYQIAAARSMANYSFYMGTSNDNLEELLKTDLENTCGLKIFMGASTGNMLVDNPNTLENVFSRFPGLIAVHCEDESVIRANSELYRQQFGEEVPVRFHPLIRSEEACFRSSSFAISLAKKHGTRLHILHISTGKETQLFEVGPPDKKQITSEACIHHLWFNDQDYDKLGSKIKWNPAIKTRADQEAVLQAVLHDRIDVIATDHAPHTLEEKSRTYFKTPSGGPLVQHALPAMLDFFHQGKISLERIVEKMSHAPARMFRIRERGFIREGYFADLVIVNLTAPWKVQQENILAKCGWSPFEGHTFRSAVTHTFVSGRLAWKEGKLVEGGTGQRLKFDRR
ncbi:MAG: dihydroorotase [Bacteroidetes bacterium]|nr:dihydroorotase [Bacteroidota bacterium]